MSDKKHEADVAFIKALAELLRENDLTELQVKREYGEDDTLNVRVSRMQPAPVMAPHPVWPQTMMCGTFRAPTAYSIEAVIAPV